MFRWLSNAKVVPNILGLDDQLINIILVQ